VTEQTKTAFPSATTATLRDMWMRVQGAILVARAAQQAAQDQEAAYKSQFRTCLETVGLDPDLNWELDMRTGELREQAKNTNGTTPEN
jgi:hypothetical protein